jgi:uncharacterized protein YeaO (DUF488 family)
MVVLYAYALSTAARAPLEIIDAMAQIQVKRIYEEPNRSDGFRVLVDRLWPRGISKERAALDLWMKTVAPSTELREWFGHDPKRWKEFVKRYRAELREHTLELAELRSHARKGPLTLLFGARDSDHNEAVVLKAALERHR